MRDYGNAFLSENPFCALMNLLFKRVWLKFQGLEFGGGASSVQILKQ
jgi:hypothetical protein